MVMRSLQRQIRNFVTYRKVFPIYYFFNSNIYKTPYESYEVTKIGGVA